MGERRPAVRFFSLVLVWLALIPCARGQSWVKRGTGVQPTSVIGKMAWDAGRERLVLYDRDNGTFEWDGVTWALRTTAGPDLSGTRLAYDPVTRAVLMFGGAALLPLSPGGTIRTNDTWAWNGLSWSKLTPASRPPARESHAMVLDRARGRIVLFGGNDQSPTRVYSDTWEWHGTTWTQVASVGPAARSLHTLIYDPVRQRTVLVGGSGNPISSSPTSLPPDTWEWDGTTWTLRSTSGPAVRGHAMAWDETQQRGVLYGGELPSSRSAETWVWDGASASWTRIGAFGAPGRLIFHSMAYEAKTGRTLLVGGETWQLAGTTWSLTQAAEQTPMPLLLPPAAFDAARGETVMYWGWGGETWLWNGVSWRRATAGSSAPDGVMAYDSARREVVLFGGACFSCNTETWAWDGTGWSLRATPGPPFRYWPAMAYDAGRGRAVMFGGQRTVELDETWEWDGTGWTQRFPANKPWSRWRTAMAYDPVRQRVVLFGGQQVQPRGYTIELNDTWEWDGTDWTNRSPLGLNPAPRFGHGLAFDSTLGKVVLVGGSGFCDTWAWDGTSWEQLPSGCGPRDYLSMVFDSTRRNLVAFRMAGGLNTWEYGTFPTAGTSVTGPGCMGASGIPVLSSLGEPQTGRRGFALDVQQAAPSAPVALLLSAAAGNTPLGGGCSLLVDPMTTLAIPMATNPYGFATQPLPLRPSLAPGLQLFAQAVVIDPAGAWLGLAFTGGLQLTLGF